MTYFLEQTFHQFNILLPLSKNAVKNKDTVGSAAKKEDKVTVMAVAAAR